MKKRKVTNLNLLPLQDKMRCNGKLSKREWVQFVDMTNSGDEYTEFHRILKNLLEVVPFDEYMNPTCILFSSVRQKARDIETYQRLHQAYQKGLPGVGETDLKRPYVCPFFLQTMYIVYDDYAKKELLKGLTFEWHQPEAPQ